MRFCAQSIALRSLCGNGVAVLLLGSKILLPHRAKAANSAHFFCKSRKWSVVDSACNAKVLSDTGNAEEGPHCDQVIET
jgi:hypothetical protein